MIQSVVSLSMSTLVDRRVRRQWFDLMDKGGKAPKESLGKVELALRWRHNPDKVLHLPEQMEADDDLQKTPNVLRICLVRARGIKVMDKKLFGKGGSSDPFVTFSLDGEVRKSTVQKKSLRPTWLERVRPRPSAAPARASPVRPGTSRCPARTWT